MRDYGFSKLKSLANDRMGIEFASMYCLKGGWVGPVTTTERDDPELQKRFEDSQKYFESLEAMRLWGLNRL
jgi:hypothetical protein